MTAEQRPCAACNAEPGEPCAWDCVGLASHLDALDPELSDNHVSPGAEGVDGLIGRAMTVEASKLYALLHYTAELDEYRRA